MKCSNILKLQPFEVDFQIQERNKDNHKKMKISLQSPLLEKRELRSSFNFSSTKHLISTDLPVLNSSKHDSVLNQLTNKTNQQKSSFQNQKLRQNYSFSRLNFLLSPCHKIQKKKKQNQFKLCSILKINGIDTKQGQNQVQKSRKSKVLAELFYQQSNSTNTTPSRNRRIRCIESKQTQFNLQNSCQQYKTLKEQQKRQKFQDILNEKLDSNPVYQKVKSSLYIHKKQNLININNFQYYPTQIKKETKPIKVVSQNKKSPKNENQKELFHKLKEQKPFVSQKKNTENSVSVNAKKDNYIKKQKKQKKQKANIESTQQTTDSTQESKLIIKKFQFKKFKQRTKSNNSFIKQDFKNRSLLKSKDNFNIEIHNSQNQEDNETEQQQSSKDSSAASIEIDQSKQLQQNSQQSTNPMIENLIKLKGNKYDELISWQKQFLCQFLTKIYEEFLKDLILTQDNNLEFYIESLKLENREC